MPIFLNLFMLDTSALLLPSPIHASGCADCVTRQMPVFAAIAGQPIWQNGPIPGRAEDFDLLLGSIAFDANHADNDKRQRAMDKICGKIEKMLDAFVGDQ